MNILSNAGDDDQTPPTIIHTMFHTASSFPKYCVVLPNDSHTIYCRIKRKIRYIQMRNNPLYCQAIFTVKYIFYQYKIQFYCKIWKFEFRISIYAFNTSFWTLFLTMWLFFNKMKRNILIIIFSTRHYIIITNFNFFLQFLHIYYFYVRKLLKYKNFLWRMTHHLQNASYKFHDVYVYQRMWFIISLLRETRACPKTRGNPH